METKFVVGDSVIVVASKERGVIKSINAVLGENENLYEVLVGNVTRLYKESYLDLFVSCDDENIKNKIKNVSFLEMSLSIQIEDEIQRLITLLDLVESNDYMVQLANACKLQKYMATRFESLEDIYCNSSSVFIDELYRGLIKKENNCFANSYTFTSVLRRVGMNVWSVVMSDENNSFYLTNIVEINNLYYYFDTTLEKEIYRDTQASEHLVLCSAGIGSKRYQIYYTPLSVIDFSFKKSNVLPENISEDDLDIKIVNRMIGAEI